jgi:hypothetical protein
MRQAEAALTAANRYESELWAILAQSVSGLLEWPRAGRAVFRGHGFVTFAGSTSQGGTTEYQMGEMASLPI